MNNRVNHIDIKRVLSFALSDGKRIHTEDSTRRRLTGYAMRAPIGSDTIVLHNGIHIDCFDDARHGLLSREGWNTLQSDLQSVSLAGYTSCYPAG